MDNGLFQNIYNPDVLSCIANLSNDEVFTPPELANKMLDMLPQELFENPDTNFLDPACKSGVFLREIAKRLIKGLEPQMPNLEKRLEHIYTKQLFGIAITELTSLLSRRSVYCSKYPTSRFSLHQFEEDQPQGNIIFQRIRHTWENGRCRWCGASQSEYDRSADLETHAYQFIHNIDIEKLFNMKFDVIIGNPPYQLSDGGSGASAKPIYNLFIQQAKKLNPRYLSMIIPARWYTDGKGLNAFRAEMLNDKHIEYLVDYVDSRDCFAGVDIAGGICYFLWNRNYDGKCHFTNIHNGIVRESDRDLNATEEFIRFVESEVIIEKIRSVEKFGFYDSRVSSRKPFGLSTDVTPLATGDIVLKYNKGFGPYSSSLIKTGSKMINEWKVIISYLTAEHAGQSDKDGRKKILSSLNILKPKEICTETYLVVDSFAEEYEAKNCYTYLCTQFVRFLVSQLSSTQHLSKEKFSLVPLQDFSSKSDINWNGSVHDIDLQLYSKYGLSEDDVTFIESMIRQME